MVLLSLTSLRGQNISYEQANAIFGGQKIVKFRQFSLDMTDEGKQIMTALVRKIQPYPGMFRSNILIIQVFGCEKELNVKPYLSVVRGQVMIDYLVENLKIPRKKCLIQDLGPSPYDKDCLSGSGANIYLRPNWEGID